MLKYRKIQVLSIILLIGLTLIINIYLTYQNSQTIENNRQVQIESEQIKDSTFDIIRNIHLLDLGIRGRALVDNDQIASAMDTAEFRMKKTFNFLEQALKKQGFNMEVFYRMQDSTEAYFKLVAEMNSLVESDQNEEFLRVLNKDLGYEIWLQFKDFSSVVNQFEENVAHNADLKYSNALRNSYWLQVILFLLVMPTLGYLSFYFNRSLSVSENLRKVKEKHVMTLIKKNAELEKLFKKVKKQTRELKKANQDLDDYNKKLEEFTFFITHHIRAPVARIKGLSNILEDTKSKKEIKEILKKLNYSTIELDKVVSELGMMAENDS
jgi:signal transduction histidine kinase